MSRFIAVLGPGRCGSSAVAGLLHHGGVPMGRDLIGPHPRWNARGHFEDHAWHWLNRLVAHRYCDHLSIRPETTGQYPALDEYHWTDAAIFDYYKATVESHRQEPVWGMKCQMLGLIWPQVGHLYGEDIRAVLVYRQMGATIHSRMAHSNLSRTAAMALTARLADAALEVAAELDSLVVRYETLLEEPERVAKRIGDFVTEGVDMDFDVAQAAAHIDRKKAGVAA